MRTFLIGSVCLLWGLSAMAQGFDFDMGQYKPAPQTGTNEAQPAVFPDTPTEVTETVVETFDGAVDPNLFPELARLPNAQVKKKKSGSIDLTIENIQIITPLAGPSLCTGEISLKNNTDETIKQFGVTFNAKTVPYPFSFSNLAPDQEMRQNIGTAGSGCEEFLNNPNMEVTNCIAEKMSVEECKGNVKLIPIPTNVLR